MELTIWRVRFPMDTPLGQRSSFVVGSDGVKGITLHEESGVVVIHHPAHTLAIHGESHGEVQAAKPKAKQATMRESK